MDAAIKIYNLLKTDKRKERFDIILDPLQAVLQLALLSFCPKNSKLNIANNILTIQETDPELISFVPSAVDIGQRAAIQVA